MRDLALAVASVAAMPVVAVLLPLVGYRRLHRILARWPRRPAPRFTDPAAAAARVRVLARVVSAVAGPGRFRATCLRRSLVLWWIARLEGIETALRIGVRREETELRAHAWVEHLGRPVNDAADIAEAFPPFDADLAAPLPKGVA